MPTTVLVGLACGTEFGRSLTRKGEVRIMSTGWEGRQHSWSLAELMS